MEKRCVSEYKWERYTEGEIINNTLKEWDVTKTSDGKPALKYAEVCHTCANINQCVWNFLEPKEEK